MKSEPRLHEMRERFVVAERAGDRALVGERRGGETVLDRLFARAEQGELRAAGDKIGQRGEQKVEALLAGQARDDAEKRGLEARRQADPLLQGRLVARAHVDAQRAVVLRRGSGRWPGSTPGRRCR